MITEKRILANSAIQERINATWFNWLAKISNQWIGCSQFDHWI